MVRLAHAKGHLTQRHASRFQHWALEYWDYMERRMMHERDEQMLEQQCFNLTPDRWREIYEPVESPTMYGFDEPETPVTDADDIDAWYESMERSRNLSGGEIPDERLYAGAL